MIRKKARTKSTEPAPPGNALLRVGWCVDREGERELIAAGIPERMVWMRGRSAETLAEAIKYFRKRAGVLTIAHDLRCLGTGQQEIFKAMAVLHKAHILIEDIAHPEDENNPHKMLARAIKALHSSNGLKDKRTAKRRGAMGGTAKGPAMAAKREAAHASRPVLERIAACTKLTWRERGALAGVNWQTLKRNYT